MSRWLSIQIMGFLAFLTSFILLDVIYHIMVFGPYSAASAAGVIAKLPLEHQIIHIIIPILVGVIVAYIIHKKVMPDA